MYLHVSIYGKCHLENPVEITSLTLIDIWTNTVSPKNSHKTTKLTHHENILVFSNL